MSVTTLTEELKQFRDYLKAHYEFYEYEQPKDLTITLTYEQVHKLDIAISIILRSEKEQEV